MGLSKILAAFGAFLPTVVFRVLSILGLSLVTYTGLDLVADEMYSIVDSVFAGVPADVFQLIALAGVDRYIIMLLSAHIGGAIFKTTFKSAVFK